VKLDLCSGGVVYKEGFIHIDKNPKANPDVLLDITKDKLPYDDASVEEVWLMHGPEHIERIFWDFVFMEVKRVLIPNGVFVLGYPEFKTCALNYIKAMDNNDPNDKKEYWLQTMYGRRQWTGDEHVTACNSPEIQLILESCGYYKVRWIPESNVDNYNSLMRAVKDPNPAYREKVICDEFGLGKAQSIQEIGSGHFV
jgi:predicted SAM-dependent methyltransferase